MTEKEMNELNRLLGALQSTVSHLTVTWERNDRQAAEGRQRLHDKIENLTTQVVKLNSRMDAVVLEVASFKPVMESHQQGVGSKKTIGLIWGGIISFISVTAVVIVEVVKSYWGKH